MSIPKLKDLLNERDYNKPPIEKLVVLEDLSVSEGQILLV